jgi:hypothetical protein
MIHSEKNPVIILENNWKVKDKVKEDEIIS